MISRFDSECDICGGNIDEGITEITHHHELGWIHLDPDECSEDHPDYDEPFATF